MALKIGDRVATSKGIGVIVQQRMAPPTFTEPEAFFVVLDAEALKPGYVSTVFRADKVCRLVPTGPDVARDMREWDFNEGRA